MPACVAEDCKNLPIQKIKICSFPKEKEAQTVWINNMDGVTGSPKKIRVCVRYVM